MNKKVIVTLALLILVVCVFAYLNAGDREDRLLAQKEAKIFINYGGEKVDIISFDDILKLEQHEFEATLRSSGCTPNERVYKGALLKDLLKNYDIPLSDFDQVVARAVDGYTVALTSEEVLAQDNVYIVYQIDGEPMLPKEEGGLGPYQLVIRNDEFGQRWSKYLMELDIN